MLFIILAILAVALDQFVKYYTVALLADGGTASLIPGVVHLTYTKNTGVAFSFLSDVNVRWILVGVSAVCVIVLLIVILRSRLGGFGKFLLSMILGGAIGNLIDRAVNGYVVDMFAIDLKNFPILNKNFPVFNVADVLITCGAILFVIYYIIHSIRAGRKKRLAETEERHAEAAETVSVPAQVEAAAQPRQAKRFPAQADVPASDEEQTTFTVEDILREYEYEKLMDQPNGHEDGNGQS